MRSVLSISLQIFENLYQVTFQDDMRIFFFFFFFFFAALTDLTLASKRPMNSMGPTGAQKSAPGPIFQDRHSGNIVINVGRGGGALPKIDCHRSRV